MFQLNHPNACDFGFDLLGFVRAGIIVQYFKSLCASTWSPIKKLFLNFTETVIRVDVLSNSLSLWNEYLDNSDMYMHKIMQYITLFENWPRDHWWNYVPFLPHIIRLEKRWTICTHVSSPITTSNKRRWSALLYNFKRLRQHHPGCFGVFAETFVKFSCEFRM